MKFIEQLTKKAKMITIRFFVCVVRGLCRAGFVSRGVCVALTAGLVFYAGAKEQPLVLQWEVSHSKNTDQISLIFRQDTVELITNTSHYQKKKAPAKLGHFKTSMNLELKTLKTRISHYHTRLSKTVPMASLIKDSRFNKPEVEPHAPILRINKETITEGHNYFKPLADIIHTAWERQWTCVKCAYYTLAPATKAGKKRQSAQNKTAKDEKNKKQIIRETITLISEPVKTNNNTKKQSSAKTNTDSKPTKTINKQAQKQMMKKRIVKKHTFSKEQLNCVPAGKNEVECVDPQFGIFKI